MKSDETFDVLDKKQRMLFTEQRGSINLLWSVLKTMDEIREDDKKHMLPQLQKMGQ